MIAIRDDRSTRELASYVSRKLGVLLHARESSYYGDPYYSGGPGSDLRLTSNNDPQFVDGDPPDERYFAPQAPEAQHVLWGISNEAHAVEQLRADGIDATIVPDP